MNKGIEILEDRIDSLNLRLTVLLDSISNREIGMSKDLDSVTAVRKEIAELQESVKILRGKNG